MKLNTIGSTFYPYSSSISMVNKMHNPSICIELAVLPKKYIVMLICFLMLFQSMFSFGITFEYESDRTGDPSLPPVTYEQEDLDDQVFGDVMRAEVAFLENAYDFSVSRDFNQVFPIQIYNSAHQSFALYTEIAHEDKAHTSINTVGIGSVSFPAILPPQKQRTIFIKVHTQDPSKAVIEGHISLINANTMENYDRVPIRIRIQETPAIDVDIINSDVSDLSKAKSITLKNNGATLANFSVMFESESLTAYLNPQITHYRFEEGTTLTIDVIPVLDQEPENVSGFLVFSNGNPDQEQEVPLEFSLTEEEEYFLYDKPSTTKFEILTQRNAVQLGASIPFTIPYWYVEKYTEVTPLDLSSAQQHFISSDPTQFEQSMPTLFVNQAGNQIAEDYNHDGNADVMYPSSQAFSNRGEDGNHPFFRAAYYNKEDTWYASNAAGCYAAVTFEPIDDVEWITPGSLYIYINETQIGEYRIQRPVGTYLVPLPLPLLNLPENGASTNELTCFFKDVNYGSFVRIEKADIFVRYQHVPLHLIKKKNLHTRVTGKRNFYWEQPLVLLGANMVRHTDSEKVISTPFNIGFGYVEMRTQLTINGVDSQPLQWGGTYDAPTLLDWRVASSEFDPATSLVQFQFVNENYTALPALSLYWCELPGFEIPHEYRILLQPEPAYLSHLQTKRDFYQLQDPIKPNLTSLFCDEYDPAIFNGGLLENLYMLSYNN